jgi:hypothetical protein
MTGLALADELTRATAALRPTLLRPVQGNRHPQARTVAELALLSGHAGVHGGAYAPYVVERCTRVHGKDLSIFYVLSTWNPYVVLLMQSHFQISGL